MSTNPLGSQLEVEIVVTMERYRWFLEKSGIEYKQHQFDGVQWALHNETREDILCHGGLIADEMGLGKTITAIGLMIVNYKPRTLIVLPNVLIPQWVNEIKRTTGHQALVFYGAEKKKKITLEDLNRAHVVITSYATIAVAVKKVDLPSDCLLHQVAWNRVLFDEAHHLRNKNSRYWGAKKLTSPIKWLLTGTPIQNKRRDLYNLCSVLGLPASYSTNLDNMRELFEKHVLRRTKQQIGIQLPALQLADKRVIWQTESERVLSKDIHEALHTAPTMERLSMYMQARKVCILPAMLMKKMPELVDGKLIPNRHDHQLALSSSSKLNAVVQTLLSRSGNGNGKLVFCHFREEIDTILSRLQSHGIHNIATFDGRNSMSCRSRTLKAHHEILILQIQTGCEGLNLQADFSEIYFVSPHWNPAIEEQAIARCHRMGQVKPVHVFRFHMNTIQLPDIEKEIPPELSLDQYIHSVQEGKREICNEILPQ